MDQALGTIAGHGILGAIIVVLLGALAVIYRALERSQAARTEDAKKVAEVLLQVNERWLTQINTLSTAIDKLVDRLDRIERGGR